MGLRKQRQGVGWWSYWGRGGGGGGEGHWATANDYSTTTVGAELTLKDVYGGLGSNPCYGGVLPQVIPLGVVAGPALVSPRVLQGEPGYSQHTHAV